MAKFTYRNKSKQPIMTIGANLMEKMLAARPESASMALTKHRQDYERSTGKKLLTDHEQRLQLLQRFGADERGIWTSKYAQLPNPMFMIIKVFTEGIMISDLDIEETLSVAEAFYLMVDNMVAKQAS